jgi:hypothetical protein
MLRAVQKTIDVRDRHLARTVNKLLDAVAGAHNAFLDDTEIKARPAVLHEQRWHPFVVQADPDLVAGHSGLAHLEDGAADPVPITHADLVVRHPCDREVFAELPHGEVVAAEEAFPVSV